MQYLLMLYSQEGGWNQLTKEQQEQGVAAYRAYTEALQKAGELKSSNRLQPTSAATTVRLTNGKTQVRCFRRSGVVRGFDNQGRKERMQLECQPWEQTRRLLSQMQLLRNMQLTYPAQNGQRAETNPLVGELQRKG
jgi:hypothetical protein